MWKTSDFYYHGGKAMMEGTCRHGGIGGRWPRAMVVDTLLPDGT